MILPTKGIPASKALITIGGEVLRILNGAPLSVSGIWLQFSDWQDTNRDTGISYDWFILTLDLLYLLGAIQLIDGGLIRREQQ